MAYIFPSDRPKFAEALKKLGFDPLVDFSREETDLEYKLIHNSTGLFFVIITTKDDYTGFTFKSTTFPSKHEYSKAAKRPLDSIVPSLTSWAVNHVKRQLKEESIRDPWDNLSKNPTPTAYFEEKFSAPEIKKLEAKVQDMEAVSKSSTVAPNESAVLVEQLREIVEDAKKEKRKKTLRQIIGFWYEVSRTALRDENIRKIILDQIKSIADDIVHWGQNLLP